MAKTRLVASLMLGLKSAQTNHLRTFVYITREGKGFGSTQTVSHDHKIA